MSEELFYFGLLNVGQAVNRYGRGEETKRVILTYIRAEDDYGGINKSSSTHVEEAVCSF